MISEYAMGKHKWAITTFFLFWGLSSILTAAFLWNVVTGTWAVVAVILIAVSGVGAIMGGLFDVKHKLHGLSFALGVPTMPIGALIICYHLLGTGFFEPFKTLMLLSSHAIWVSLILMAVSMMVMFSGFKKAGIPVGPDQKPPEVVPPGVIALGGYANRLLVLCYAGWNVVIVYVFLFMFQF